MLALHKGLDGSGVVPDDPEQEDRQATVAKDVELGACEG